jgi:hypothetical protein
MAPLDDLIHPFLIAFKKSLYTTVSAVFNPTFHSQFKSRFLSVVTEEDSLDPSFNDDPRPYFFHMDLETITGSSQNQ